MTQQPQTIPFNQIPRETLERHIVQETNPRVIVREPPQEEQRAPTF